MKPVSRMYRCADDVSDLMWFNNLNFCLIFWDVGELSVSLGFYSC